MRITVSIAALFAFVAVAAPALAQNKNGATETTTALSGATGTIVAQGQIIRPPNSPGPYRVGRKTFAYVDFDRENRLLVIDAWYPVARADAAGVAASEYDLVFETLASETALASPPVAGDGPFPLVVFSHGNLGIRFQSFFLMELLASHGFVVVAPDHAGNTAQDLVFDTLETFEQSAQNRPVDIRFVIDAMLARNANGGDAFYGAIDAERIGVSGHSFGGYTALAAASGLDGIAADTRIDALLPVAPASGLLSDAALQSITQPTLLLGGTADTTTPIDNQTTRPYQLLSSTPLLRADLVNAGHQSFTDICIFTDVLIGAGIDPDFIAFLLGNASEGCAPELMPIERAHDLSELYSVAFFKVHLAGDPRYQRFLDADFAKAKGLPVNLFAR